MNSKSILFNAVILRITISLHTILYLRPYIVHRVRVLLRESVIYDHHICVSISNDHQLVVQLEYIIYFASTREAGLVDPLLHGN